MPYKTVLVHVGVKSFEEQLVNDELAGGIGLQARYCDLVVLGQPDPDEPQHDGRYPCPGRDDLQSARTDRALCRPT
ncbi:MAG: universal stress protein [Burkholderia sp.]|jgi:hypothetical protein|nr:universal stress protein [Burkholderia sp.]